MAQDGPGYAVALRHPIVRRLWLATAVSTVGDHIASGALMILAYQRTGLVLGPAAVFAIQGIPALLSGALAGSWLDRIPRGRALVILQLAGAACVALPIVAGSTAPDAGTSVATVAPIFVAAALLGAVRAATISVRSGAMAEGVPDIHRGPLLGLMNTTEQSAQVVGYLTGTALAYRVGAGLALFLDAASFVVGAIILATLSFGAARPRRGRPPLSAGLRDILADPVLRMLAPLVMVTATVGAIPESLAAGVAPADSLWVPIVFAAAPAGQAVTMFVMGRSEKVVRPSVQLTQLAWLALAFGIAALGRSAPWFAVSNLLVGSGVAWSLGPQLTFIRLAPTERMAQITGTMIAVLIASEGLGTPLFALLADRTDVRTAYRVAGVLVLLAALVGWFVKERTPAALALDADAPGSDRPD